MNSDKNLTIIFTVDKTPAQAFEAITQVSQWWSRTVEGGTSKAGDEFVYRHKDIHYSKQKLIEVIPGKKMVWRVLDAELTFVKSKREWEGTEICFELVPKGRKTELQFMHVGLTDSCECFQECRSGWNYYVGESLRALITTGAGKPD